MVKKTNAFCGRDTSLEVTPYFKFELNATLPLQAVEQILLPWAVTELQNHPHQQLQLHHLHPLFVCACCHKTLETAPVEVYLGLQLGQVVCWPVDNNNVKDLTLCHAGWSDWSYNNAVPCSIFQLGVGKTSCLFPMEGCFHGKVHSQCFKNWPHGALCKHV